MSDIITAASDADIQAALRGEEAPEAVEAKEPEVEAVPAWSDVPLEKRTEYVTGLVYECLRGIADDNATLRIWIPQGFTEEVKAIWAESIKPHLEKEMTEDDPLYLLYFPIIEEYEMCRVPELLTRIKNLDGQLSKYLQDIAAIANVDLAPLDLSIGLDLPTKKAFYLFMELGIPALERLLPERLRQRTESDRAMAAASNKIIAPPARKLHTMRPQ